MRAARGRRLPSSLSRVATAWWGPVALGAFALWQFSQTAPGGHDDVVWAAVFVPAAVLVLVVRRRLSPTEVMALEVLATALFADFQNSMAGGLRDLHLYLNAGAQFMDHGAVYTTVAIHSYPKAGLEYLPFLYAPPTLPIFGLLSELPRGLADGLWVAGSVAAVVVSMRAFGLAWRWALLALIWTPIEQGLFTGNVVIPSLLVLAAAMRLGGMLVLGPLLKPQNGIVSLWLIRERAWRRLGGGLLALLLLVLATLPLVGIDLWRDWLNGLSAYQESQQHLNGLYGVGLGRYLPMWAFLAIAALTLVAALWVRGREGLARLGLASVVASPSLWSHGFVFGIPSFLRLRAEWLWLVAGMMSIGQWPGPQVALGIGVAAWFVKGMARPENDEKAAAGLGHRPLHLLGSAAEPWPSDDCPRPRLSRSRGVAQGTSGRTVALAGPGLIGVVSGPDRHVENVREGRSGTSASAAAIVDC